MKQLLIVWCLLFSLGLHSLVAQPELLLMPEENSETEATHQVVWETEPGVRYEAQTSIDLEEWDPVPGYPAAATRPVDALPFLMNEGQRFYRVQLIDEQAPKIVAQAPKVDEFAVGRFSDVIIQLSDASGVEASTLSLTVGARGTFTVASPELSFADGLLRFENGGDTALGAYGDTVTVSLTATDVEGNTATYDWTFDLEVAAQIAANVFVFGSPEAQRMGQQIGSIPTRVIAQRYATGPIRMSANASAWTIDSVAADNIVLAYTGATAPAISAGTLLSNLTPASRDEIFYRRATNVSDDAANKLFTIYTEDVDLEEIVQQGALQLSDESLLLVFDSSGQIAQVSPLLTANRALSIDKTFTLPLRLGYSLDGATFTAKENGFAATYPGPYGSNLSLGIGDGSTMAQISAEQLNWWFTPRITTQLEIGLWSLSRFRATMGGEIETAADLDVSLILDMSPEPKTLFDLPPQYEPEHWVMVGAIGVPPVVVPIFAVIGFDVKVDLEASAEAGITFNYGYLQHLDFDLGVDYLKGREDAFQFVYPTELPQTEVIPFTVEEIFAEMSVGLALKPQLKLTIYKLAGVAAGPKFTGAVAVRGSSESGFTGELRGGISLDMERAGIALEKLDPSTKWKVSWNLWEGPILHLFPPYADLSFLEQPESRVVEAGAPVSFSANVTPNLNVSYQWYQDGIPIPHATDANYRVTSAREADEGSYHVKAWNPEGAIYSDPANLTVGIEAGGPAPVGFARIPAGNFQMGDALDGLYPVETVYVPSFYMGRTEVTYAQWQEVYNWAIVNDYGFNNAGSGKGANHPVHSVSWYDVVKWCNAASERAGRSPVYRTGDGSVYRTGQISPTINTGNSGYRLPSSAEWEKAARGGLTGRRFPWGDTISHSNANYYGRPDLYTYDIAPPGFHPAYDDGGYPYSSPVGSFSANGYGLYDVAGNMWEWCNDSSGSNRVRRGGGWFSHANFCRVAFRYSYSPSHGLISFGFRLARSQ